MKGWQLWTCFALLCLIPVQNHFVAQKLILQHYPYHCKIQPFELVLLILVCIPVNALWFSCCVALSVLIACDVLQVEVKPYVLDDQMCDECHGSRCAGKFAPFFCANVTCLQYYCEYCWAQIHSRPGREFHKPLVKEGADRPRAVPFRWC